MPRGKRTVYALYCADPDCPHPGGRIGTVRFHRQDKNGVAWKEHMAKLEKYCPDARKKVKVKGKEEKHST